MKIHRKIEAGFMKDEYSTLQMDSVENIKRRHALPQWPGRPESYRVYFDRLLNVRKVREFVFITKAGMKTR